MTLVHTQFPLSAIENCLDGPVGSDDEHDMTSLTRDGSTYSHASEERRSRQQYAGRDTDRFFGTFEEEESEAEEQPAELVPLGIRGGGRGRGLHNNKNKNKSDFRDFYKLTNEHLGTGAYASVKTCISKTTGKEYAVKVVDKKKETHTRSRILREVNTFKMCKNHPNIVQLVEWFEDDENFYLIFEKMLGGPLLKHIQSKGYFTEEEARMVTKDIASALKFLHDRGVAHRDVKPENVLCTELDRVSPVKLCDLDLASRPVKGHSPPRMTQVASEPDLDSPVGSAEFMAPEVVDAFVGDALKYDKRCDMWSLGVILYIMLCGYAPFQGECSDEDCGWMDGLPCEDCQQDLFQRIQHGQFDFPEDEWSMISEDAKDLVSHLLVKNVRDRFTADQVLSHPWVKQNAPRTILQTPSNLFRNDSARDVQQMSENFNAMSRLVGRLSGRHEAPMTTTDESAASSWIPTSHASPTMAPPTFAMPAPVYATIQQPAAPQLSMTPAPFCFYDPFSRTWVYPQEFPDEFYPTHNTSISGKSMSRRFGGSMSRNQKTAESCQTAVARQDSLSDLHQLSRETEVNV